MINELIEIEKNNNKNTLMFYLNNDMMFNEIPYPIPYPIKLDKNIPKYIRSFKNKDAKKNLFINQLKNDTKNISNNPEVKYFLDTIYKYNDTVIDNLSSKIDNKFIKKDNKMLDDKIVELKGQINEIKEKIQYEDRSYNKNNNINKNLINIQPYTDVIKLYFMNLNLFKLIYTNSS
jgi:hypothetical protein